MTDSVVKKPRKPRKLTSSQLRVLGHLEQGRPPGSGLSGRSSYGGFASTMGSLCHRGLIVWNAGKWSLTDAGRADLAASVLGGGLAREPARCCTSSSRSGAVVVPVLNPHSR